MLTRKLFKCWKRKPNQENREKEKGTRSEGEAKRGMENKEREKWRADAVIMCRNKQEGHVEQNIPVSPVLLHRAAAARG